MANSIQKDSSSTEQGNKSKRVTLQLTFADEVSQQEKILILICKDFPNWRIKVSVTLWEHENRIANNSTST